jgi:hypothetical protein
VVEREVLDGTPRALAGCVVFDRNNWKCRSDRPWATTVGFSDGKYLAPLLDEIKEVSKLKWWIERTKSR